MAQQQGEDDGQHKFAAMSLNEARAEAIVRDLESAGFQFVAVYRTAFKALVLYELQAAFKRGYLVGIQVQPRKEDTP